MSIARKDYIVVGADLRINPENHYKGDLDYYDFYDTYSFQSRVGNITFIDDLYNGDYFIVGEVLQASDGYDGELDYSLFGKEEQIDYAKTRVKAFVKEQFDIDITPHVIVKTQWS